jgi:RNA polymerase sigma factor (TIGR02999 family)
VSERKDDDRVTEVLEEARAGKTARIGELVEALYPELHRVAAAYMRRERPGQTIQATALVNEAYLRLVHERHVSWQNRAHFCAIAANTMRQILVERARARHAAKRGGGAQHVTLVDAVAGAPSPAEDVDVLALDAALERLAALDPARARLVELRYFGGLTIEETAEVLGSSPATVKRSWALARAWLRRELAGGGPEPA